MSALLLKDAVSVTGQTKVLDASTSVLKEYVRKIEDFGTLVNLPVK